MSTMERQHGVKGVYYGGEWLDIEECSGKFNNLKNCSGCDYEHACPRSTSRNYSPKKVYDVCVIGAGCIGAAIARELSKYDISVIWLEAADDVSQGATKGNSGIVHAGYDDKPGSERAKHCWPGNQMFAELDKELRFGYQKNGSLVLASNDMEKGVLKDLLKRGKTNGVKNLRIIDEKELKELEPHAKGIAALYAPEAGQVIPYEFTIALAENAVDNGVELLIRSPVTSIEHKNDVFHITVNHWEPREFVDSVKGNFKYRFIILGLGLTVFCHFGMAKLNMIKSPTGFHGFIIIGLYIISKFLKPKRPPTKQTPLAELVKDAGKPYGNRKTHPVNVDAMLVGGSGSEKVQDGQLISKTILQAKYVINCAGGAADQVARFIGDESFKIKPRLGDYLLLNRNQGHLTKHTLFPCPDPVLGKGVLVQTTLWGNLILGPTARDTYKPEARDMSHASVQEYILSRCRKLCSDFDPKETFHAFCGSRAKSDRGDWIIEWSKQNDKLLHVAGIDSPGLAGAPSIAKTVSEMLKKAKLNMPKNAKFNPNRAPIIIPKNGMKGLKMGPVGKFDSDGSNTAQMAANVICKCEKVTELEVITAVRRSLPVDSSQAIRKRTRAGMGHCQGDCDNYNCEGRVRAIVARETGVPVKQIGSRPWPATSTLPKRWIDDKEKEQLKELMMK